MLKNISIRLDEKTIKEIEEIAVNKKRKRTDLIRIVIENYINQIKN